MTFFRKVSRRQVPRGRPGFGGGSFAGSTRAEISTRSAWATRANVRMPVFDAPDSS